MASQRLTKSDRDFIAANFIKPIESKFESKKKELTEMDAIRADKQRIKNQTICILEDINTTKQLKDQFPEGYAILMSCSVTSACDDIEKLRAEWSKYMK